jgi:dTDP-4-dehydrorhamnose reductase
MRLLITGASGQLGAYLLRELRGTSDEVTAWSGTKAQTLFGFPLEPVDLVDFEQVDAAFRRARPTVVIHAAAVANIAACYRGPGRALAVNTHGSAHLADLAAAAGTRFVQVSTDLVFDGDKGAYQESDVPSPLSMYGKTKQAAEESLEQSNHPYPRFTFAIARLSLLYGPTLIGRPAFFDEQVSALRSGQPIRCFVDEWRTPLDYPSAARALLALAGSVLHGHIHIGGPERLSRWDMACKTAAVLDLDRNSIVPVQRADIPAPEPRPRDTSLDSSFWRAIFPTQPWSTMEVALREMMTSGS